MNIFRSLIIFVITLIEVHAMDNTAFRYYFWWPINTFDPYEADAPPIMQVARNIYAPLVSMALDGTVEGLIAESWEISEDGKIWDFNIRKNLTFSDGTTITPQIVLDNFRRILWLTKDEGVVLNSLLPEIKEWKDINKKLKSIFVNGNVLTFKFSRRPISLFETISQPMYGITHPKNWSAEGHWINPLKTTESGEYQIEEVRKDSVVLKSRKVFKRVKNAPDRVEILFPHPNDNVVRAIEEGRGDLTVEHSFGLTDIDYKRFDSKMIGVVKEPPVRMHFIHLNRTRGILKDLKTRNYIRDRFLFLLSQNKNYKKLGKLVDPSFIPKGGIGYTPLEIKNPKPIPRVVDSQTLEFLKYPFVGNNEIQSIIEETLFEVLNEMKIKFKITNYDHRTKAFQRMKEGDFDLIIRGTGILIDNPYADLRLMFLSKMGANIPDLDGKISYLVEQMELEQNSTKRNEMVTLVNKKLWENSEIITFAHSGVVYLHKRGVDLSRLNLFVDPIEFRTVNLMY